MNKTKESENKMIMTAFDQLFIARKEKIKKIKTKLKKVQQELTDKEFHISNTFEKMIGKTETKKHAH